MPAAGERRQAASRRVTERRPAAAVLLWAVAALVSYALIAVVVVTLMPEQLASLAGSSDAQRAEDIRSIRTALLAMLAGALAAVGAVHTVRTFELNREGQITERFTRGVDQLGHGEADVRVGGIYALERIARDSDTDHPAIMEVLTAYVRSRSRQTDRNHRRSESSMTRAAAGQLDLAPGLPS